MYIYIYSTCDVYMYLSISSSIRICIYYGILQRVHIHAFRPGVWLTFHSDWIVGSNWRYNL